MPRSLLISTAITVFSFIAYWLVTALYAVGWLDIPADWLYKDYHDARAIAWNWSFFPLDMLASGMGLWSIAAARAGRPNWPVLSAIAMTLTSTAGGMAIVYWTLLREFDLQWFLPNLVLFAWPLFDLAGLISRKARGGD